jgi:hypothetical protein
MRLIDLLVLLFVLICAYWVSYGFITKDFLQANIGVWFAFVAVLIVYCLEKKWGVLNAFVC